MCNYLQSVFAILLVTVPCVAAASEYQGKVTFNGLPVPGATVEAVQGVKSFSTVTDQNVWSAKIRSMVRDPSFLKDFTFVKS